MFRYLNTGTRLYGDAPISLRRRSTWEFQAVVAGRIAPLLPSGPQIPIERTLWALPPTAEHGWTGIRGCPAEVLVLHPLQVPPLLEQAAKAAQEDGRLLMVALTDQDIVYLREMYAAALQASHHPDTLSGLKLERIIIDLSLLVLTRISSHWLPKPRKTSEALIVRTLAWMEDHLTEDISITDACAACGCSPAHLRRLFHSVRGCSPRQALSDVRLQRADQYLADPSLGLAEVARLCGYADAATLCRTYRSRRGTTPRRMPRTGNPTPRFRS